MDYFLARLEKETHMVARTEITKELLAKYSDVSPGIGCFKGTFSLQAKDGTKPYQVPPRHVAYGLQDPFKQS